MNLFQRKRGVAAVPTNPQAYGDQVAGFMAGLTFEDKARVVAATKTDHGDLELRLRYLKDGTQQLSLWLCLRGTDEAIKLVPVPTKQEAAA